jgi:hypothetical protein
MISRQPVLHEMMRRLHSHPCPLYCYGRFVAGSSYHTAHVLNTRAVSSSPHFTSYMCVYLVIAYPMLDREPQPNVLLHFLSPSPFDARLPRMRIRERSSSYQPKPAIAPGLPSHMRARDSYHSARGILYAQDVAMRTRNNAILAYGSSYAAGVCKLASCLLDPLHSTTQASCHSRTRWHSFT